MRTFAIGDIHGKYNLLKKVLRKAEFNYDKDKLIILGDVVDKGKNSKECIEELTRIKNKIFIIGNHDARFKKWISRGGMHLLWRIGGGQATLRSYGGKHKVPEHHKEFLAQGVPYYIGPPKGGCFFLYYPIWSINPFLYNMVYPGIAQLGKSIKMKGKCTKAATLGLVTYDIGDYSILYFGSSLLPAK